MYIIENGSTPVIMFLLTDATDNETAEIELTVGGVDVYVSKNGGSFAVATNSVTEVGRGWYKVSLTATETNTDGPLVVEAVYTGTSNIWRWMGQVVTTLPAELDGTERNSIADHVLRRGFADSLASSDGDTYGRYSAIGCLLGVNKWRLKSGDSNTIEVLTPAGAVSYEMTVAYSESGSTGASSIT